jgi:eukaryotic-like serine/threonine-protein kinase
MMVEAVAQRREPVADLESGRLLETLRQRGGGYALLGLPLDASSEAALNAAQALSLQVTALLARPLRISAVHEAERLLHTLTELKLAFETPKARLVFDAELANWRGIAHARAAGVPDEALEQLRRGFLANRPRAETVGWVHAKTSAAWEARSNLTRAMTDLIDALSFDPLNAEYHRRLVLLRAEAEREKLL